MQNYFKTIFEIYDKFILLFVFAFVASFLITPFVGFLAKKLKIVDIPASKRKINDSSVNTRISKKIVPRAGGFGVTLVFLIIFLLNFSIDIKVAGILISVVILLIVGILDDKFELPNYVQFILQFVCAIIVVACGISIDSIDGPLKSQVSLRKIVIPFQIFNEATNIALPADLFTIIWILLIMNAINWLFGIDGIGEGISVIAFLTIFFISVKNESSLTALIAILLAGGVLGFLPYNLSPSKIFSGTTGTNVYGFLIAVLSILGGIKGPSAYIVLSLPIIDMIWVVVGRIIRAKVTNPLHVLKVIMKGDNTHFHHRLLKLGLSSIQIDLIEYIIVMICAAISMFLGNLPKLLIVGIVTIIVLLIFLFVSILLRKKVTFEKKENEQGESSDPDDGVSPEKKYAY